MSSNARTVIPANRWVYGRMARISRPKLTGMGSHEGVLLPNGYVIHLAQEDGVQLVTLEQFAHGHVTEIRFELAQHLHPLALEQLHQLVQQRGAYDLILNNCEIFARQAVLQKPESPQVLFWALLSFIGVLMLSGGNA